MKALHSRPVIQCREKSERQPRAGPGITFFGSLGRGGGRLVRTLHDFVNIRVSTMDNKVPI